MSQCDQVLRHLKKAPITPMQALQDYGCMRLAARIDDLRGKGYRIKTEMVKRNGKRFARYRLDEKKATP